MVAVSQQVASQPVRTKMYNDVADFHLLLESTSSTSSFFSVAVARSKQFRIQFPDGGDRGEHPHGGVAAAQRRRLSHRLRRRSVRQNTTDTVDIVADGPRQR